MRNMLFISHANPEDNEFTRWLSLQLAREDYPVWCDLTKLLGGEDFWRDIEEAIRNRTAKFLYVLSKTSNTKGGTLKELAVAATVAKQVKNFILPLKIDGLRHDDTNIEINRLNALDFSCSWATGLSALLHCLAEEGVPRNPNFNPGAVAQWWRQNYGGDVGITDVPDTYLSNWYEIQSLPDIHLHFVQGGMRKGKNRPEAAYPIFPLGKGILSFASLQKLEPSLRLAQLSVTHTDTFNALSLLTGANPAVPARDARNAVLFLLRSSWESEMLRRGLMPYQLAGDNRCYWFKRDQITKDKVFFVGVDGKRTDRQLVGKHKQFYWHFAIQARPMLAPFALFSIRTHIVFTNDDNSPIPSASQQHSARRGLGKNWWTPTWRDRLTAMMTHLAAETPGLMEIDAGGDTPVQVRSNPCLFESPCSFSVIEEQPDEPLLDDDEADEEEGTPNVPVDPAP